MDETNPPTYSIFSMMSHLRLKHIPKWTHYCPKTRFLKSPADDKYILAVAQAPNVWSHPWFLLFSHMPQAVWWQILLAPFSNITRIWLPYSKPIANTLGQYLWTDFLNFSPCLLLSIPNTVARMKLLKQQSNHICSLLKTLHHLSQNECQSFIIYPSPLKCMSPPHSLIFSHLNYSLLTRLKAFALCSLDLERSFLRWPAILSNSTFSVRLFSSHVI